MGSISQVRSYKFDNVALKPLVIAATKWLYANRIMKQLFMVGNNFNTGI